MTQPLYRIDIAPLTPLPLTRSPFFSYRHNASLALGTLVQIPFGRRSLRGIVYAANPLPGRAPLWLKPIERVIREGWLTHEQRELALRISDQYFSSLGNTLKHFVVPLAQKTLLPTVPVRKGKSSKQPLVKKPRIKVVECGHDEELWEILEKRLHQSLLKKEMLLILVPDLLLLATLETKLQSIFPHKTITLSSKLTPKQTEQAWHMIRSNERPIILGTRQAVFAPFPTLEHIIALFPEERLSYKQWDMTPNYEALTALQELSYLFSSSLTYLSTARSLSLQPYQQAPSKKKKSQSPKQPAWRIIDQRQDGRGARSRLLAKPIEALLKTVSPTSRVLFIAKERGVSGVITCQKCHTTARCPVCHHALAENKAGLLRCLNCRYESNLFPTCAQCGHHHFKSLGIGTVKLERELEKLFPHQALLRLDRDSLKTPVNIREHQAAILSARAPWIITTPEIGSLLLLPKQDFVVMLEADHTLAFPDFEGEEKLFIILKRLQAKLLPFGQVIIQTFTPEERLWQFLSQDKEAELLLELHEEREHFGYPPVTAIIKISLLDQVKGVSKKTLEAVRERCLQQLPQETPITLTPVFQVSRYGGTSTPHFLIKYPADTTLPDTIHTLLRRESAHLKIDVHPLHLH